MYSDNVGILSSCPEFSPEKKMPAGHPNLYKCKGCVYGEGDRRGENCPAEEFNRRQEPEERIENRPVVVATIPIFIEDEDGQKVEGERNITVNIPHRAKYLLVDDPEHGKAWLFSRWERLREPTKEEIEEAKKETGQWE